MKKWLAGSVNAALRVTRGAAVGNAMRFLGLEPGGKTHQRLAQSYQDHEIVPLDWF